MKSSRDIVTRSGDIFHQMGPEDTEIMFPRVFVVMGEWIQWKENDRLCQNITIIHSVITTSNTSH